MSSDEVKQTDPARFVRIRCPICNMTSPVVDQQEDVRRDGMGNWWQRHRLDHLPHPIIEVAEREGNVTVGPEDNKTMSQLNG